MRLSPCRAARSAGSASLFGCSALIALAKLLRRVTALQRTLRSAGTDLHYLADVTERALLEPPPLAAPPPPRPQAHAQASHDNAGTIADAISFCTFWKEDLSDKEHGFILACTARSECMATLLIRLRNSGSGFLTLNNGCEAKDASNGQSSRERVAAKREAELRAELGRLSAPVLRVPAFEEDIHDLSGLARLGECLFS